VLSRALTAFFTCVCPQASHQCCGTRTTKLRALKPSWVSVRALSKCCLHKELVLTVQQVALPQVDARIPLRYIQTFACLPVPTPARPVWLLPHIWSAHRAGGEARRVRGESYNWEEEGIETFAYEHDDVAFVVNEEIHPLAPVHLSPLGRDLPGFGFWVSSLRFTNSTHPCLSELLIPTQKSEPSTLILRVQTPNSNPQIMCSQKGATSNPARGSVHNLPCRRAWSSTLQVESSLAPPNTSAASPRELQSMALRHRPICNYGRSHTLPSFPSLPPSLPPSLF
jgi:hypothetical protein